MPYKKELSRRLICSDKFAGFNISAPGANTGITGGITFERNASACRLTVALTAASVLNVTCTDGTTEHKWHLNSGGALGAENLVALTFAVRATTDGTELVANGGTGVQLTYDFEVETDGVIEQLLIEEVQGAVV